MMVINIKNEKMKNNSLIYILAIVLIFGLSACESVDDFPKVTQEYVGFASTSASFSEVSLSEDAEGNKFSTDNSYNVTIIRSTTDYSESVTVSLTYTATYLDSTGFADVGDDASDNIYFSEDISTISFEAGQSSYSFDVFSKDNGSSTGNISIQIQIQSVSAEGYTIGYEEAGIKSGVLSLTLVDDDCPVPSLAGTYNVVNTEANPSGCAGRPYTVTIEVANVIDAAAGIYTYSISDITGGMYTECYGASGPNPAEFSANRFDITLTAQPDVVYGNDQFDGTGTIACDGSFTIIWSNGFGDSGTSVYTK